MPDCDYCDRSFEDQGAYLEHLGAEHEGELGRIDRRRVEHHRSDDGREIPPTVYYAVGGIVLFLLSSVVVYYAIGAFSSEGDVHEHGTIEITLDGEQVSFTGSQYTDATGFHFHGGGPVWHMHPREPGRMTLAEAMDRIGIELTGNSITIEGETYDASEPGTELAIRVNGEEIDDPATYELHGTSVPEARQGGGDNVEIVVETGS